MTAAAPSRRRGHLGGNAGLATAGTTGIKPGKAPSSMGQSPSPNPKGIKGDGVLLRPSWQSGDGGPVAAAPS